MTDKVQKIREEVERLFNHVKDSNFESDSGAFYYLKDLLDYIDTLQEEPVSEDLDGIAREYAGIPCDAPKDLTYCVHDKKAKYDAVLFGAQWQKEQMTASGTDVTVHIEAGNYPYIPQIELYDYDKDIPLAEEGDKYKVILIKKD